MDAVLASYGSYNYLCVTDGQHPFWSHTRVGRVLHVVTEAEHAVQAERGLR
jgi:hypothetical protein